MSSRPFPTRAPRSLIRPAIQKLHPYVPGEQPRIKGLIKLNTNENPYPPSPKVLAAIKSAADSRLRLYPNPTAQPLREKLARLHHCQPENIIIGNGSDELLAMAVRCFVEPACSSDGLSKHPKGWTPSVRCPPFRVSDTVQFFTPSYSLYPVLADIHGAAKNPVPLNADFSLPSVANLKGGKQWDFQAALTLITTPNAPTGRGYRTTELDMLCQAHRGVLVLDEAYVDFAEENASELALTYPHVLVSRTFSKAYSLCFQRVGYFVGHPDLIAALQKIRDSYNVNGLGQIAALATLDNLPYYQRNFRNLIATREQLARELTHLGFNVLPSQTNFLLARPPKFSAQDWMHKLRRRRILVRHFDEPLVREYLRITIGLPRDAKALLAAAARILSRH